MSPRPSGPRAPISAGRCRCGAAVLSGLCSSGYDVAVDRAPLSALGELEAVLAGVHTYTHHSGPGELHHRSAFAIRTRPAGSVPRQTVHPVHLCGTTWPALPRAPVLADLDPDAPPPY